MKKLCTVFLLVLSMLIQFVPVTTVQAEAIVTSRLAGDDRYATAVAISQAGWTEADTIIIATGLNYPDALAASSLTKSKDAPILLTRTDAMDQNVVNEIDRLNATQAILVGGSDVVGPGVEDQLRSLGISSITRLGGIDRYDTSVKVGEMLGGTDNGIIVATGLNFPDALSIAPIAAMKSIPILLSPQNALEAYVSAFIANKTIPVSYIAGGSDVVADSIATGLPNSKRLSGDDRYGTNMSIIKEFAGDLNFDTIYLATGLNFPDALSGSAIAAKNNAPIILTEQDTISQDIINLITSKNVKRVVFLGGTDVVSQNIEDAINGIVRVTSVSLDKSTESMVQAKLMTLTATVKPETASNKNVTWSSSAPGIASVSSKGVVTAKNAGEATITATAADGNQTATCIVTVSAGKLTDYKAIYENDNDNLENLYVTIVADNTVTFDEVNDWNVDSIEPKPEINVRFDYGTPASDTTGVTANAVLSPRGKLSTFADLKSYKIKLSDAATKWKGQKTLNLNKHPYEMTRIRNKLCFDLMKMFPDAFSLRTQFTHVYIRDLNSSNKNYVDYGLFTHVEDVGKDYLESRGIERTAYIYKAEDFEFLTYPDVIKNVTDPSYSLTEFEKILEVKGVEEHSRLIAMLKDVNDESQDINDVISKWFDRDNYITWFAMNILLNNTDTNSANFFIMSPVDQDKWYFIPWDYDFSLGYDYMLGFDNYNWSSPYILNGASMYWGATLHRRFLQDPQNIVDLSAKIEELSAIATEEVVEAKVSSCYDATNALVKRNPDLAIMGTTVSNYENEILRLPSTLAAAKQQYYDGLDVPMPFKLNEVQESGGQYTFTWEESYDLDGDALYYDFEISSTPDFDGGDIIEERSGLQNRSVVIDSLENGTYYWRVQVYDSSGNRMVAFGSYFDEAEHFGVKQLIVN